MSKKNNFAAYVDIVLHQFNSGVIDLHLKTLSSRKYKTWLASQKIISLQKRKNK